MTIQGVPTFCWFELATTRVAAAKDFYRQLFGWSFEGMPLAGGGEYVVLRQQSNAIGGMFELTEETGLGHMPPNWSPYVAVDSADAAARRAQELGASLMKEPFDVMEIGRMAVLRDPTGAMINLWQATGPGPVARMDYRAQGHVCWCECQTRGAKRASQFYEKLFGWKIQGKDGYIQLFAGDAALGGFFELEGKPGMENVPSNWMLYFATEDVAASTSQVEELGGQVYVPPQELANVGTFSVVSDPQGATFTLFKLNEQH